MNLFTIDCAPGIHTWRIRYEVVKVALAWAFRMKSSASGEVFGRIGG
jgi:hypothetical protein